MKTDWVMNNPFLRDYDKPKKVDKMRTIETKDEPVTRRATSGIVKTALAELAKTPVGKSVELDESDGATRYGAWYINQALRKKEQEQAELPAKQQIHGKAKTYTDKETSEVKVYVARLDFNPFASGQEDES